MSKLFKWLEKITQRLDRVIIKICIFNFFIGFVSYSFLYMLKNNFSEEVFQLLESVLSLIIIIGFLAIPIAVIVKGIVSVKRGFHNLRKCDDSLFENIDFYKVLSREDYLTKIGIINFYYKPDGAIDELVKNNDIYRLYVRKDFLTVRKNLFNDLTTYFYSLIISIIASIFCEVANMNDAWQAAINICVVAIMFFIVITFKYVKRGQDGSYAYQVEEFELRLLDEKIKTLEDGIVVTEDETKIIKTRQYAINALQNLCIKSIRKKSKNSIKKDIAIIQNLRLSLNSCPNYELREIAIDNYVGYMAYSKSDDNGKEIFASEEFSVLYSVIHKYFSNEKIVQEKKEKMNPNEKHLEFLQNNIGRMNQCSFHMKGWAITLASALIAVFVSTITKENPGNKIYIYAAIASTILFWFLDSIYMSKERKLIAIYNDVIGVGEGTLEIVKYEIPINKYKGWKYSIFRAMLFPTEIILYGAIILGLVFLCNLV